MRWCVFLGGARMVRIGNASGHVLDNLKLLERWKWKWVKPKLLMMNINQQLKSIQVYIIKKNLFTFHWITVIYTVLVKVEAVYNFEWKWFCVIWNVVSYENEMSPKLTRGAYTVDVFGYGHHSPSDFVMSHKTLSTTTSTRVFTAYYTQIGKLIRPTWRPPGSFWPQMGSPCWPHDLCYQDTPRVTGNNPDNMVDREA